MVLAFSVSRVLVIGFKFPMLIGFRLQNGRRNRLVLASPESCSKGFRLQKGFKLPLINWLKYCGGALRDEVLYTLSRKLLLFDC